MNSYKPTNWLTGNIITSVGLNNIEHGIKLALTDINNLITETQQNSTSISSIRIDISDIQDDINILNTGTQNNIANINSIRTNIDDIQSYANTLNTKILNNKNNIDILDENINTLLTNINNLNIEIQGNKNDINLIKTNITGIQNDIDSAETNITNIQSNINSIETDIDDIQTSLNTLETSTNTNIQEVQTNINNLSTQVNNNKTNVTNIQNDIDSMETDITNIQNDIDSIKTNITNAQTNINNLDTKVGKNENDINSIETNIDTILTNIDNLNTKVQNTATETLTAIKETKKIAMLNIAGMVEGELTSQNIVTAINLALDKSSSLYIPSGQYSFNIDITSDCTIHMDKLCFISSATANPAIHAQNCSINLIGGNILNGVNNDSRVAIANKKGLIFLENCYNSSIIGINSPYSKANSVIWIKDCENFVLEQSTFSNMLRAAMFVCGHCVNVTVRNCKFTNSVPLDGQDYCYFVYTGSTSFTDNFEPVDGLIYENNYCSNSEDCGLDTHGARNVIIRNNVVLNTVCAITAYNDNKRMTRPEGWKMENILIENNYCDSTKQNIQDRKYPHPFLFIGASKDGTTEDGEVDSENLAFFDEFRNCIVRNNTFRTANNYQYGAIFTDVVSRNLTFENNTFRFYEGATASIQFRRSFGSVFKNNRAEGGTAYVIFKQFSGEVGANVGFRYSCDEKSVNYVKGLDNIFPEISSPTYRFGDTFWSEVPKICTSYGTCAKFSYKEYIKTFDITVTDGIATVARNLYIPHLALTLSNDAGSTNVYIKDVIDIMHFLVVKGDQTLVPDGTYTATIRNVTAANLQ